KGAKLDPAAIEFIDVLDDLETYIRGKERLELVKAVKDAKVDIFGSSSPTANWKKLLGNGHSNIVVHDGVPFDQALELMHKSKIVLNSCAWIKNGTHERTLSALAAGAAVITAENTYMKETFTDGVNICFYRYRNWDTVNSQINTLLSSEDKRTKI